MKRTLLFAAVLLAAPLQAQTVEERLSRIERALGDYLTGPQMPCDSVGVVRQRISGTELPNGEFALGFQQKRLNCIIEQQARIIDSLRARPIGVDPTIVAQVQSIAGRLPPDGRSVQEYVNSAVATIPTSPVYSITGTTAGHVTGFGGGVRMKEGYLESLIFTTPFDRAARWLTNTCADSIPSGHTYCDVTLAQQRLDFEQNGMLGIGYFKPHVASAGPWDSPSGKALVIQNEHDGEGRRGKYVEIFSGIKDRGLSFGVSRTYNNVVDNGIKDIYIDPENPANPVRMKLDGVPRRLYPCGNQVCWQ